MIVVEGPDGAGKTTLVQSLQEAFGFPLGERATKNRDHLYKVTRQDTYTALALEVGGQLMKPLIWDRLFWSELVYADVVGRPVEFSPAEEGFIKAILRQCALTIVCLPPLGTVLENVATSDHEMDGVKERIGTIWERYKELFMGYNGHLVWYDYSYEQTGKAYVSQWDYLLDHVEHHIAQRKERLWTPIVSEN